MLRLSELARWDELEVGLLSESDHLTDAKPEWLGEPFAQAALRHVPCMLWPCKESICKVLSSWAFCQPWWWYEGKEDEEAEWITSMIC